MTFKNRYLFLCGNVLHCGILFIVLLLSCIDKYFFVYNGDALFRVVKFFDTFFSLKRNIEVQNPLN